MHKTSALTPEQIAGFLGWRMELEFQARKYNKRATSMVSEVFNNPVGEIKKITGKNELKTIVSSKNNLGDLRLFAYKSSITRIHDLYVHFQMQEKILEWLEKVNSSFGPYVSIAEVVGGEFHVSSKKVKEAEVKGRQACRRTIAKERAIILKQARSILISNDKRFGRESDFWSKP